MAPSLSQPGTYFLPTRGSCGCPSSRSPSCRTEEDAKEPWKQQRRATDPGIQPVSPRAPLSTTWEGTMPFGLLPQCQHTHGHDPFITQVTHRPSTSLPTGLQQEQNPMREWKRERRPDPNVSSLSHRDWLWERHVIQAWPMRVGPGHFAAISRGKQMGGKAGGLLRTSLPPQGEQRRGRRKGPRMKLNLRKAESGNKEG